MIRRTVLLIALLSACRGGTDRPAASADGAAAEAPTTEASRWLVTQRKGAVALDTAHFIMAGPLRSTAGWTSWQVSYETNLAFEDSVELAAQADSVFQYVLPELAQRTDSTAFMEAHVRSGLHSGYRFLYHRLADGSWERVP